MNFLQLVQLLEHRLGHHQVPINPGARELHDLFDNSPLHHELMPRIARAIYKANGCRSLRDPVAAAATFDAIAPIRLQVLRAKDTDVDVYRVIEEVCTAVGAAFDSRNEKPASSASAPERAVVPFARTRRVRSLA